MSQELLCVRSEPTVLSLHLGEARIDCPLGVVVAAPGPKTAQDFQLEVVEVVELSISAFSYLTITHR